MLQISVSDKGIRDAINKYLNFFTDLNPVLKDTGDYLLTAVRNRIQNTKTDPNGVAWAPMSPSTTRNRLRRGTLGGGLLNDSGNLLNSIRAEIGPGQVSITSSAPYAQFVQQGTSRMPPRQFLGWSEADRSEIVNLINKRIQGLK